MEVYDVTDCVHAFNIDSMRDSMRLTEKVEKRGENGPEKNA